MRSYLKQAPPKAAIDWAAIEDTVRGMLAEIARERDEAVRRYAAKLDRWSSPEFRVSEDRIRDVARAMPETFKEDFEYARRKVTDFAQRQRDRAPEARESLAEPDGRRGLALARRRRRDGRHQHEPRRLGAGAGPREHGRVDLRHVGAERIEVAARETERGADVLDGPRRSRRLRLGCCHAGTIPALLW